MSVTKVLSKNQFSITANLDFNNFNGVNALDPVNPQDVATKNYVDAVKQGLDLKDSVRAATTANITLSGTQTIDSVVLVAGNRVLVKDQTTASANGLYNVSAGAWTRASDADVSSEVTSGLYTYVEEGTLNGGNGFTLTTTGAITLGTTALTFTQFSGAGTIVAGAGLTKTGNSIDVISANSGRIVVAADSIDLATSGVTAATYGNTGFNVPNIVIDAYGRITTAANRDLFGSANAQNTVFAAPSGSSGSPSFRTLVASDIPNLDATKITTGLLSVARGGTGVDGSSAANGSLLIGNGSGYALATITQGSGITVTNAAGSITIASTAYTASNFVDNETPSGTINGSNTTFTLANTPVSGSEKIFVNGVRMRSGVGNDYTISTNTITFLTGAIPETNSVILADYRK